LAASGNGDQGRIPWTQHVEAENPEAAAEAMLSVFKGRYDRLVDG
jgi:hypothetical protein